MAEYKDLIPKVQYDILGAPQPVVISAIKDGFIMFCEKTLMYTSDVSIDSVVDQLEYDVTVDDGFTLIRPVYVKGDAYYLSPTYEGDVDIADESLSGDPTFYYMTVDKKLRFTIKPKDVNTYTVRCAIKPSHLGTSTTIPDYLVEDYEDAIISAAKYKLFGMRGKDWSSKKSAQEQNIEVRKGVSEARARMWRSYTNVNKRTKYQIFGG